MGTVERADEAARSVISLFGGRAFGWVPFTHLGAVVRPGPQPAEWHYWWQAHFVDCLLDAAQRRSPHSSKALVVRHVRGMWLRNGFTFDNPYFDDMAWLALAAQRAERRLGVLDPLLRSALIEDDEWGGGAFWHADRDFKNTAATGPIALYLARTGDHSRARRLLAWLGDSLADPDHGLYRDGLRRENGRITLVPHVFSYNQGPVLGLLLELGDRESLDAAARHVDAIALHLTLPGTSVLRTHGGGDGGLFTGILGRYLGLAARDHRLPARTRATAAELVAATAADLWDGREERGWRGQPVTVFPQDTGGASVGQRVELASQLQAWMLLESHLRNGFAGTI